MKKLLVSCALIIVACTFSIYCMFKSIREDTSKQVIFNPYTERPPLTLESPMPPLEEEEEESRPSGTPELPEIPSEPLFRPITPGSQPMESPKGAYRSFTFPEKSHPELEYEMIEPELQPQSTRFSTSSTPTLKGSENDAIITFNNEPTTTKCIGLICVHGTFSKNKAMGADQNRLFSEALQSYAKKLAVNHNATVKMFMPQWSGKLLTQERQFAANRIAQELERMDRERRFDELHGIGHSHGCNVLLNLALIGQGESTFNVRDRINSLTLIAPPRVEFTQFYNYPSQCFVYAFNSRNDATQQLGSLERGQWFQQRILIRPQDIGHVYNIEVEYLPEIGMPHHKSIKHLSLMDCLPGIQQFIATIYKNYPDLKLWITKDGVYRIALAINHDKGATTPRETDAKKREIAETTSNNVLEHLPKIDTKLMQDTGYLLLNLFWELMYKEPMVPMK